MMKKQKNINPSNILDDNFKISYKEEFGRWLFTIAGTLLTVIAVGLCIAHFYTPDIELLKEKAAEITFLETKPEPLESLLFQVTLLLTPLSLLLFYWISLKMPFSVFRNRKIFLITSILTAVFLFLLIYVDFSAANATYGTSANEHDRIAQTNFEFFFHNLFLQNNLWVYALVIFPLLAAFFFFVLRRFKLDESRKANTVFSIVTWIIVSFLLIIILNISTFDFPYTWQNKFDFNAVFYSVAQVYGGGGMLVDGLTNTYGSYPQLLNPLFQLIGLDVFKFSLVMSILICFSYFSQALLLNRYTKNKFIFLLGIVAVLFLTYFDNKFMTDFDAIFAITPIRILTFSTVFLIAALYAKSKSKVLYYIANLLIPVLIIWNPEFGIISFMGWLAFLCYMDFYDENEKINFKGIIKHIVLVLGGLVTVAVIYSLTMKLVYGSFPDFIGMFKMMSVFGGLGFNMLPIPLIHQWNLWFLFFVLSLTYAISKLIKRDITAKSSAIFLLSIIGAGTFMYYIGRSHNWNFAAVSGIGLLLITLLADDLWSAIAKSNLLGYKIIFSVFIFFMGIPFTELIADTNRFVELTDDSKERRAQLSEEKRIENNQAFIKENTGREERIIVLTSNKYQGLYFYDNQNQSGAHPGFIELVTNKERDDYAKTVIDSSFKIFIEPSFFYYGYHKKICAAAACTYQYKSRSDSSMMLLEKREYSSYFTPLLGNEKDQVLHEVFQDDSSGFYKRVDYALGVSPVEINNGFSFEVIFEDCPQIYPYPALISNLSDSTGFAFLASGKQGDYFVSVANYNIPVKVIPDKVNYVTVNIDGNIIRTYVNGTLQYNVQLQNNYLPSSTPFYIGNHNTQRYYLGPIMEVSIVNRMINPNEIMKKWEILKSSFPVKGDGK